MFQNARSAAVVAGMILVLAGNPEGVIPITLAAVTRSVSD